MTGSGHDHYRDLTAAYVVGALEAAERTEIEEHLRTCEPCRREVVAFAPLPGLLGRLDRDDLDAGDQAPAGADAIVAAVRADIDRLGRSHRRWRWGAGVAAAAVVVLLALLVTDSDTAGVARPTGHDLEVQAASTGADATVVASEHPWGTYVRVSTDGMPERDAYTLWVVDEAGAWERAGSWAPTPGGEADLGGSTRLVLAQIDRVVVTSSDRDDELLVAR